MPQKRFDDDAAVRAGAAVQELAKALTATVDDALQRELIALAPDGIVALVYAAVQYGAAFLDQELTPEEVRELASRLNADLRKTLTARGLAQAPAPAAPLSPERQVFHVAHHIAETIADLSAGASPVASVNAMVLGVIYAATRLWLMAENVPADVNAALRTALTTMDALQEAAAAAKAAAPSRDASRN